MGGAGSQICLACLRIHVVDRIHTAHYTAARVSERHTVMTIFTKDILTVDCLKADGTIHGIAAVVPAKNWLGADGAFQTYRIERAIHRVGVTAGNRNFTTASTVFERADSLKHS
jgi:hypothetical protein